jgi:cardiolipin synthase
MRTKNFNPTKKILVAVAVLFFSSVLSAHAQPTIQFFENSHYMPLIDLINATTQTLDIEIYTMKDANVDQAIRAAMTRKVKVRIVQEPTTDSTTDCRVFASTLPVNAECVRERALVQAVIANGGAYVPFQKQLCGQPNSGCFEHGKIAIFDGSKILLSTGNFDPTNLCDASQAPTVCNRDYTLVLTDPDVIETIQTIFNGDLAGLPYDVQEVIDESAVADELTVSPYSLEPLIDFIDSAQESLQIETQYLNNPTMNAAIIRAANRGVAVSVMVASACAFGKSGAKSVAKKWNQTYSAFDTAGVQTWIFDSAMKINGKNGYNHAKAIIVDETTAWIGSVNGSTNSLTNNREYGIFTDDPTVVEPLNHFMTADQNNPNGESWADSLLCKMDGVAASD